MQHHTRKSRRDIIKDMIGVPVVVEQRASKPQRHIASATANIISIWSVILSFISYFTLNTILCQNKDWSSSACSVLHQEKLFIEAETSNSHDNQAEKHLIQQIDSAQAQSSQEKNKHRNNQLATRLIQTHRFKRICSEIPSYSKPELSSLDARADTYLQEMADQTSTYCFLMNMAPGRPAGL